MVDFVDTSGSHVSAQFVSVGDVIAITGDSNTFIQVFGGQAVVSLLALRSLVVSGNLTDWYLLKTLFII